MNKASGNVKILLMHILSNIERRRMCEVYVKCKDAQRNEYIRMHCVTFTKLNMWKVLQIFMWQIKIGKATKKIISEMNVFCSLKIRKYLMQFIWTSSV